MPMGIGKRIIWRYVLYVFFFLLAGALQWLGFAFPFTATVLFVLSSAIFFALVIFWAFALQRRMPDKRSRRMLMLIAALLLLFLVLRFARFYLFDSYPSVKRYLAYSYYLVELFVPALSFFLLFSYGKGKVAGIFFLALALILFALTFSNDLHQWAFVLNEERKRDFISSRGPLFYIDAAYTAFLTLLTIVFLVLRCWKMGKRIQHYLPFLFFFASVIVDLLFLFFDWPMYKIPELLCFTFMVLFETCILVGLFPNNGSYKYFFSVSSVPSLILDEEGKIEAKSSTARLLSSKEKSLALEGETFIEGDIRVRAEKIPGGYLLVEDDLSSLKKAERVLEAKKEALLEEKDILLYENELSSKEAALKQRKAIFAKIDDLSRTLLPEISLCLFKARQGRYQENVKLALLRLAYLKRKANLLLKEEDSLPLQELGLAISESLRYCLFPCAFTLAFKGKAKKDTLLAVYGDFEAIAENVAESESVLLRLEKNEQGLSLRFLSLSPLPLPARLKGKKREKRIEEGSLLILIYKEG